MCPTFGEFITAVIRRLRGDDGVKLEFNKVCNSKFFVSKLKAKSFICLQFERDINNMHVTCPIQVFIDGEFCDAADGKTMETIDPSIERAICSVPECSAADIDRAVRAADEAFFYGEWQRISARERGRLMSRLADLMDECREELATLEAIDSGAVYTLALKTHIGM